MTPATRDELVAAWEAWDEHPSWVATAGRYIDAKVAAADDLGWHHCRLHDALLAARRTAHDHAAAVDLTVDTYEAGEAPAW
jgi:hypothetical protein